MTGFALSVDGVRTDYGLTPRQPDGTCACSIALPFSSGRHTLIVSAYNAAGETASAPFLVGPTAKAGGPYSGQAGVALSVNGGASTDASGTITSYVWNWGDGTGNTSTASTSATHVYGSSGTYSVTLTVNDNYAASHSATTTATIAAASSSLPSAPANPTPASGSTGVLTNATLTWSASGATSYDVQFGSTTPPPQVTSGQSAASYAPGSLAAGRTYYWRVVARNSAGATSGPIWSFTTQSASSSGPEVVIYASDLPAGSLHGTWSKGSDATSPGGVLLQTPDAGWSTTNAPSASPADYVDVPFTASAGTPYTLWLRMRALNNSKLNDAVWVQFSDALANGSPVYPVNSSQGLLINLATDATAASLNGWGWQNGAYWLAQPATFTFAANGSHTLRIQVREDGVRVDQIVLSASTYLSTPPGPASNDSTIVPRDQQPAAPANPSPANGATSTSTTPTLTWSAAGATSYDVQFGTANPPPQVIANTASASYAPPALAASTTYYWRIVAHNGVGTTSGAVWSFATAATPPSGGEDIVIYAGDIPAAQVHGNWTKTGDSSAAGAMKLSTPDAAWSSNDAPQSAPAHYVDVVFDAPAATSYTLWLRLRATSDSKYNDAVWVQFSDARAGGSSVFPLNSTSGLLVNLASDSSATSLRNWGWEHGAYWLSQPARVTFAAGGSHTVRIQVREDGVQFDQIVLSPTTFASTPPGSRTGDTTIVPK